jgi:glycosyltransferase involved in cell wall biosynthesis
MKLIIQIPCNNEAKTLPVTLKDLPKSIKGIDKIETLIINDGSTDDTEKVARSLDVNHIVNLPRRRGLAYAFKTGLDKAVELGADIIVNTDGDNQYKGEYIHKLVEPITEGRSDIVIGCRDMASIKHFSFIKKCLQKLGSYVVRKLSNSDIPDATSGFRAYSKDAAMRINVFSSYTYTLETIIQAGRTGIAIVCVPIMTNEKLRESRLMRSIPSYIARSIVTIIRIYLLYEPLKFFSRIGILIMSVSMLIGARYAYFFMFGVKKGGHLQSLLLGAVLFITGFMIIMIGLLADTISANRKINEDILYRLRKKEIK